MTKRDKRQSSKKHSTRHGLHPAFPVVLAFVGIAVISLAFGMLIFPLFAKVCAPDLLNAVSIIGYGGVAVMALALLLEAYNLYEHHKQHVTLLIFGGMLGLAGTVVMLYMAPLASSCV